MKYVLAFMAAATVMIGSAFADGAVNLTTWDCGSPIYIFSDGRLAGGADWYAEILSGGAAIVSTTPGMGSRFPVDTDGNFDAGYGLATGVPSLGTAALTLRVWKGAATFDMSNFKGTLSWTQAVGDNPAAPTLPTPAKLNIPTSIIILPEPSTIALGMLGAAALFVRRRKF
jgi:hypothetical protein